MSDFVDLVAIVAAPVSGLVGAWIGGVVQARRDDARWTRELRREDQRWRREDTARWLGERRSVYGQVTVTFDAILRQLELGYQPPYGGLQDPVAIRARADADRMLEDSRQALADLSLLADDSTDQLAYHAHAELGHYGEVGKRMLAAGEAESDALDQRYEVAWTANADLRDAMRAALRVELGCVHSCPIPS